MPCLTFAFLAAGAPAAVAQNAVVIECRKPDTRHSDWNLGGVGDSDGVVDNRTAASMTIPTDLTGIPGQVVVVPIQLKNVIGNGVRSAEIDVTFDSAVLAAESTALDGALTDNCKLTEGRNSPGRVLIAIRCTAPLSGSPILANMAFGVVGQIYGSATALRFRTAKLNEGWPAVTAVPGSFTVSGPEICDGQDNDGNGLVDEICAVSGNVVYYRDSTLNEGRGGEPSSKPVANVGMALTGTVPSRTTTDGAGTYFFNGLDGTVTVTPLMKSGEHNGAISALDAAAVAMAAVGNASLSTNQVLAGEVTGDHAIDALDASYIARFSAGLVKRFPVAQGASSDWRFLKRGPDCPDDCGDPVCYTINSITGPETAKNFYAILYGDVTGNWQRAGGLPAVGAGGESSPSEPSEARSSLSSILSMPDTAAGGPASTVYVPISATPGDGIFGADLTIQYDPAVVSATNVTTSGIATAAGFALVRNLNNPGTIVISMYATSVAMSGSGEIARIEFHVVGAPGSTSVLTFTHATINEGSIPAVLDNGLFTVTCAGAANGTTCNDGNPCTIGDQCSAGSCIGTAISPPNEVTGVSILSDRATITWAASPDAGAVYDVVRGHLATLPVGSGGGSEFCAANDLTATAVSDTAVLTPGDGFWYLVRAANTCGVGTYGNDAPPVGPPTPRVTSTCQ